ncbi:MAG: L-aspartate oxidase [Dissulfurispiraceae bacterium]|jgi:L-aspartate oxidase|nr:L-aspartate oxidase [Dissulfurispiraceae bacterium]
MQKIETDFIVIGSGVAGLRAAIELAKKGNVLMATKDAPKESSTEYAQGGVAVALSDEDEVGIHFEDTIKAGDGLCREDAVKKLVEEGPERILELIEWGAEFDREGTKLDFTLEGAHSRRRVLHAHGDSTGRELERVLTAKAARLKNVRSLPFCLALDLIIEDNICKGAYLLKGRDLIAATSASTVIATGGTGQIFSRTTNPAVTTGDGVAIAYRAGAALEDMEFIQFHPTALYAPSAPQFLLSEAIRGEGGLLRNINKDTFMQNYHPDKELASRDIVSRAIMSEMVRTGSTHVYLDMTHLEAAFIKKRFPRIYTTCLRYDVDITRDMVPVSPAAHYMMGGIKTDLDGASSIKGLYAAGEVSCTGVHGANRLASNSLLEGLVYGYRAGAAASCCSSIPVRAFADYQLDHVNSADAGKIEETRSIVRRVMWEKAGIIRCEKSLREALLILSDFSQYAQKRFDERSAVELSNMLTAAMLIASAALERKGSVGAHFRSDFKYRGEEWSSHILMRKDA